MEEAGLRLLYEGVKHLRKHHDVPIGQIAVV